MLPITLEIDFRYITSFNAHYLLQKSILAAIPYIRTNGYPCLFISKEFIYDEYFNSYICPNNKLLTFKRTKQIGDRLYKSNSIICKKYIYFKVKYRKQKYTREIPRHDWQNNLYIINDLRFVGIVHKAFSCQNLKKVLVVK